MQKNDPVLKKQDEKIKYIQDQRENKNNEYQNFKKYDQLKEKRKKVESMLINL